MAGLYMLCCIECNAFLEERLSRITIFPLKLILCILFAFQVLISSAGLSANNSLKLCAVKQMYRFIPLN